MSKKLLCKAIAEYLGTLAIVLFGCGTIAVATAYNKGELLSFVPLVFGATVGFMIYAVGHVSGAHFNPAVTIAFAAVKRFPRKEIPVYIVAQILGATTGAALVRAFVPGATDFGLTQSTLTPYLAVGVEFVLTFFLMFVIISVATDSRAVGMMAGAAIGITVTVDAFFGGPLTGASMNPARTLGPALVGTDLSQSWVYWLGPIMGAVTAAKVYEFIRCEISEPTSEGDASGCC